MRRLNDCRPWAVLAIALLPAVALGQKAPAPSTQNVNVVNQPLVNVGNTPDVNVVNQPTVNISGTVPVSGAVAVTGTPTVAVANTPTVLAQQSGSWTIANGPSALGDHFQVAVRVTMAVNLGTGQVRLNFPRPGLIEQFSADCLGTTQKTVRVSSSVNLNSGFTTDPNNADNGFAGEFAYLEGNSVNMGQGWAGGFVPPTPARLVASSCVSCSVILEVFRDRSNDGQAEFCTVFLVGRWIAP